MTARSARFVTHEARVIESCVCTNARWRYKCKSELTQNSTFTIVLYFARRATNFVQMRLVRVKYTESATYSQFILNLLIDIHKVASTNLFCARPFHRKISDSQFCSIFIFAIQPTGQISSDPINAYICKVANKATSYPVHSSLTRSSKSLLSRRTYHA